MCNKQEAIDFKPCDTYPYTFSQFRQKNVRLSTPFT